jgi:hypothetical protein
VGQFVQQRVAFVSDGVEPADVGPLLRFGELLVDVTQCRR